ncbi:hypothetical protein EJB05_25777, partial [Eragrostis curvula]
LQSSTSATGDNRTLIAAMKGFEYADVMLWITDAMSVLPRTSYHGHGGGAERHQRRSRCPRRSSDHVCVVLLGDLNNRISMDAAVAHQLVRAKTWSKLLEKDELLLELSKGRQFNG